MWGIIILHHMHFPSEPSSDQSTIMLLLRSHFLQWKWDWSSGVLLNETLMDSCVCHRDWLIRPSPWALKPLLSISLQQKPPHLGYNTYYPFGVVETDILCMHNCLMIRCECTVLPPWIEMTFCFTSRCTSYHCVFSQSQPPLINSELIFYQWEQGQYVWQPGADL